MTTRPPPPTLADPDTFEARWDRWVAKGIRRDQVQHARAIRALAVIVPTVALAAAWMFTIYQSTV